MRAGRRRAAAKDTNRPLHGQISRATLRSAHEGPARAPRLPVIFHIAAVPMFASPFASWKATSTC